MNKLELLADAMFPHIIRKPDDYEAQYPERDLGDSQVVTRFAPSPTGFMHIGHLYSALIDEFFAKQRKGVFIIRIEDTDQVRLVDNGVNIILDTLKTFGITSDEGAIGENEEIGDYGPYKQSMRKEIYQAVAKELVRQGKAYPCFCSEEEVEEIKKEQIESGSSFRGYGLEYAKCRNLDIDEAIKRIQNGESFITRLRAPHDDGERITLHDLIRGDIEMDANRKDEVLIKNNGLPTYHFAHIVDDHFMRTTHVIRGDEWISSAPLHLQLFKMCGYKAPKYAHVSPILKLDGESKRKLSKRKDPEARVDYFFEQGYPIISIKEYLMNLINSSFEDWREKNPNLPFENFTMKLGDIGKAGALFDFVKLDNVSKKLIKNMQDNDIFDLIVNWTKTQNPNFYQYIQNNSEKFIKSISIWHHNRMDIARWGQVESQYPYLYNDNFIDTLSLDKIDANLPHAKEILVDYLANYDENDEQSVWFDKMKTIAEKYNYAPKPKDYKNNPEQYNGSIIEVSTLIRECLTGQKDSPDIYQISQFVGLDEMKKRINKIIELL